MSSQYRVALEYQSDKPFLTLVNENLTLANYAHSPKRSRVVSVRGAFATLLGGVMKDSPYSNMPELFIAMALGNYHIESKSWMKFVTGVARAVGYGDLPTHEESKQIYAVCCGDYEASNTYVSAELRTIQENIFTQRQAEIAEREAMKLNPVEQNEAKIDEKVATVAAAAA